MQLPAGGLTVDIGAGAAADRPSERVMQVLAGATHVDVGAGTGSTFACVVPRMLLGGISVVKAGAGVASEITLAVWDVPPEALKILMEAPGGGPNAEL